MNNRTQSSISHSPLSIINSQLSIVNYQFFRRLLRKSPVTQTRQIITNLFRVTQLAVGNKQLAIRILLRRSPFGQLPTTNFSVLSANCQLPSANFSVLSANCQLPTANFSVLSANCKLPTANSSVTTLLRKNLLTLSLLSTIVLTTSCTSQKKVTYFQPKDLAKDIEQAAITQNNISKLQPGDILGIMVSSLSPEASAMFNPYINAGVYQTSQANSTLPTTPGYLIDEDGTIALPLVGKLKVAGLSNKEVTDLITEKLTKYLAQPTVNVRILNFKISVLGEVARPSVYIIPNEKVTLPEALSLAGDLTIYGKRENILLIREVEGKREFARIDITQRDFFNSPYYYLKANDVLYVEPRQRKITAGNVALQVGPLVVSTLTLLIIIIANAKNLGL